MFAGDSVLLEIYDLKEAANPALASNYFSFINLP